jgi:hypothetical protein
MILGAGTDSTIRCGVSNNASANCSAALSGQCNTASGYHSVVGGGFCNTASCPCSTISGGECNTILTGATYTNIGGGNSNTILYISRDLDKKLKLKNRDMKNGKLKEDYYIYEK